LTATALVRSVLLLAGFALVAFLFLRLGPGQLVELVAKLGWAALVFPPLYAVHHAIRTVALSAALQRPGQVPFWRLLLVRLTGEAAQYLTFTGPLLAEPTKAWMLRREGLQSSDAVGATATEYVAFTCTASVVSLLGLVALRLFVPMPLAVRVPVSATAIGLVVLLLVVVLGLRRRWPFDRWILAGVRRVGGSAARARVTADWVSEMVGHVFRNLRDERWRLRRILACETVAQALIVLELYLLLRLFDVQVAASTLLIVEGVSKVSNFVFFFIPARAGTDEATLVLITGTLGLASVVGLGVSLVRRARSLMTGAVGLVAVWLLSRRRPVGPQRPHR
jgi:glycosyltransferase 2 family protein